jgi:transposase
MSLEGEFALTLAQARSVRAMPGRKRDLADARRIAKRLLSDDLTVSYVPPPEQREWRLLSRARVAMQESVSRLHSQIEVLLEQAQIKLSSVVSDILGLSGRRILHALADGATDPEQLAALGDRRLRASKEELSDALWGRMTPAQRLVLKLYLEQIEQTEKHMAELEKNLAAAQSAEQDTIVRLCGHPGISTLAAQQIIAEVGPRAAAFASANRLASWVGISPGSHESAGVSSSNRCPHGNRMLRRVLSQIAWAAIVAKGSEAQRRYRHWLAKQFSPPKAAWAVAHYILRVIWHMLHESVPYTPPDPTALDPASVLRKAKRVIAELTKLGYTVSVTPPLARGQEITA